MKRRKKKLVMKLLSVWLVVLVSAHVLSDNMITAAIEDEWWRSGVVCKKTR